jgi:hypothetical protein
MKRIRSTSRQRCGAGACRRRKGLIETGASHGHNRASKGEHPSCDLDRTNLSADNSCAKPARHLDHPAGREITYRLIAVRNRCLAMCVRSPLRLDNGRAGVPQVQKGSASTPCQGWMALIPDELQSTKSPEMLPPPTPGAPPFGFRCSFRHGTIGSLSNGAPDKRGREG